METEPENLDLTCSLYPEYENICDNPKFIKNYLIHHDLEGLTIPYGGLVYMVSKLIKIGSVRLMVYYLRDVFEPYFLEIRSGEKEAYLIPYDIDYYKNRHLYDILESLTTKNFEFFLKVMDEYWPIANPILHIFIKYYLANINIAMKDVLTNKDQIKLLIERGYLTIEDILFNRINHKQYYWNPDNFNIFANYNKPIFDIVGSIYGNVPIDLYKIFQLYTINKLRPGNFFPDIPNILFLLKLLNMDKKCPNSDSEIYQEEQAIIKLISSMIGLGYVFGIKKDCLYNFLKELYRQFSS